MALTKIPSSLLDTSGGFDLQGNITLGDNEQILLGDSSDLAIYHSGAHSFITDSGTGDLIIQGSNAIRLRSSTGENMAIFNADGAATLQYDNLTKITTSSTGATVTGTLTVTGDLDITGDINSYNLTDLDVTDQTITLGAGQTEANSGGSGIIIDGSSASILWDETNDVFDINKGLTALGNVGIGTSSPQINSGRTTLTLSNSTNGGILEIFGASDTRQLLIYNTTGESRFETLSGGSEDLVFIPNGSESVRFDSSGNVGIGTDNPDYKLEVNGDVMVGDASAVTSPSFSAQQQIVKSFTHGSTGVGRAGNLYLLNTNTTGEAGFLTFGAYYNNTNNLYYQTGGIGGGKETSTGDGTWGGYLNFWTTSDGTAGSASGQFEHMRITADGNVGIGTTSPNSWASYTDSAATVLQVQDTNDRARMVINGGNGAHLDLVDYGGGTDDKHMNVAVDGGILKFGSLNDAGNAFVQNNIMTMDLGTGNVGIGTNSPSQFLDVRGHTQIGDGGGAVLLNFNATGNAQLKLNNAEKLRITSSTIQLNGGNQSYSDNQRVLSESENITWPSSTSAQSWTSSNYLPYQKFVEAALHFGYSGNGAISQHFYISLMNHFTGLSIQTIHSASGNSGNSYHTISFTSTGAYNTRRLVVQNTPAGGQNTANLNGTIYYGFAR